MPPMLCTEEEVDDSLFLCTDQQGRRWWSFQPVEPDALNMYLGPFENDARAFEALEVVVSDAVDALDSWVLCRTPA